MRECQEATLSEILSDPIVLMVMAADGVDPREFESNLRAVDRSRKERAGSAREGERLALNMTPAGEDAAAVLASRR